MKLSRRSLLKAGGGLGAGLALAELGFNTKPIHAAALKESRTKNASEFTSICTFCSCGCGMLCHVKDGKLINLEGDPDHIINEGALCSKGSAMAAIPNSDQRIKTPLYRAPGSDKWQEISWDEALTKVAAKIKETRDKHWIATEKDGEQEFPVNRTDAISFLGGAQNNNEECYLMSKMSRLFGAVFIEHQARLCHSSTVASLGASFGRGAMTNHWLDFKNAKVFLIEGSNCAENHTMSMRWLMKAKEKGAVVIHVDPRFTRTSSLADIYACIRPGTDIAFLNAVINYIVENNLYDADYVKLNTNALLIPAEGFAFNDGLFSGYNTAEFKYDTASWGYQLDPETKKPLKAESLEDPRCVFAKLKDFFKRYTLKVGAEISGIPEETIKLIADTLVKHRPGTVLYALGMTQHTVGVQNIRSFGVLQLLLGNIGKPGGGINALRGEPNVQGSSDMALLFNILPGYLACPNHNQPSLADWTKGTGTFRAKFFINLLKAWFGENATAENDYGYSWLPKKNAKKNYSIFRIFETAYEDSMKMLYIMGQNPMVSSPNLNLVHDALAKLDMLVVADPFMTETAAFWEKPGTDPKAVKTEVIFLPAASFLEKEGTVTNSGRLVQWRYTGIKPPGQAKSDLEIIDLLFRKVRELYAASAEEKDQIFKRAVWNYPPENMAEAVLKEINGSNLKTGEPLKGIAEIQADGSTSAGCWVYAGVFGGGKNLSKRKDNKTDPSGLGLYRDFAWSWPGNMKVLYNRASCDAQGKPLDEANKLIWWDADQGKWAGHDTPDVPKADEGPDKPSGQRPFRMAAEGLGRLFTAPYKDPDAASAEGLPRDSSSVAADGPFPEFYEPMESPTGNVLHPSVAVNPCVKYPRIKTKQPVGAVKDYPYVLCTSSLAEHWCAGTFTRNVPWLNEMVPETFVEIPEKLASKLGIASGDKVRVWSARGELTVPTLVTKRMQTLQVNGQEVFIVWMPYNWGYKGLSTAASTNLITIDAGDPNTWIQETKACLVNLAKA